MVAKFVTFLQKLGWPLRGKIALAFALVLFCFLVNGLISVNLLFTIRDNQNQQQKLNRDAERVQRYLFTFDNQTKLFSNAIFIAKSPNVNDQYKNFFSAEFFGYGNNPQPFERDFAKLYAVAADHFSSLERTLNLADFALAARDWQSFRPDFDKVTIFLNEQLNNVKTLQANSEQTVADTISLALYTLMGLTGYSLVLTLILLFLIEKVFVNPLNKLQQALEKMANGALDQKVEIYNVDEIGKLANSFQMALLSLQKVLRGVQVSEHLQRMTGQLTLVSQQQSIGSEEQVKALAQVRIAMQELGYTANSIADRAGQVADLVNNTLNQIDSVAEAGQYSEQQTQQMITVTESTIVGVEKVGQQVEEFSRLMHELDSQSDAISKIVELINSIARGVHLLALNAAIEAAGSGQYGSRFQVVAREIRQLAGRANLAGEEAQKLVNQVQNSSRAALLQVTAGQKEIQMVLQTNNTEVRQSLQNLENSTQRVAQNVAVLAELADLVRQQSQEIKHGTEQQRQACQEITSLTEVVEQVAGQTSQYSNQISDNSTELMNLTVQLNGVLSQVRLAA